MSQEAHEHVLAGRPTLRRASWLRPLDMTERGVVAVHPHLDRALTPRELARAWSWPDPEPEETPSLDVMLVSPPPAALRWIKRLADLCEHGMWGDQDWATDWRPRRGVGASLDGWWAANGSPPDDKTFDLRLYIGSNFDEESYEGYDHAAHHRFFNVAPGTGRLVEPWDAVRARRRRLAPGLGGDDGAGVALDDA